MHDILRYIRNIIIFFLSLAVRCFVSSNSFDERKIKKILISRECCIGDILMSTPLVRSIKKAFPEADLDYMVGDWSRDVLKENPNINIILNYVTIRDLWKKSTWQKLKYLHKKKYDLIIVGDVGFAPILTAFLIGASYRVGFDMYGRGFMLTHKITRSLNEKKHETEAYLELIRILGFEPDLPKMDLFLTNEEIDFAERFYMQNSLLKNELVICLFPGGGMNPGMIMPSKRWGEIKYAELADKLIERYGAKIIILGGPGDIGIAKKTASLMERKVIMAVGKVSLRQTAALIKLCNLFIGNDSGLMHVAAAVGRPTVSIFGPTDPDKLAPIGEMHVVVRTKVSCSPCYRQIIGDFKRCDKLKCMDTIKIEEVLFAVEKQLERLVKT